MSFDAELVHTAVSMAPSEDSSRDRRLAELLALRFNERVEKLQEIMQTGGNLHDTLQQDVLTPKELHEKLGFPGDTKLKRNRPIRVAVIDHGWPSSTAVQATETDDYYFKPEISCEVRDEELRNMLRSAVRQAETQKNPGSAQIEGSPAYLGVSLPYSDKDMDGLNQRHAQRITHQDFVEVDGRYFRPMPRAGTTVRWLKKFSSLLAWLNGAIARLNHFNMSTMLLRRDMEAASALDIELKSRLSDGVIRLVDCWWLLNKSEALLNKSGALPRNQELPPDAFLSTESAVKLLDKRNRSVLALTYGWLTSTHADPNGSTLRAVKEVYLRALEKDGELTGPGQLALFWE